LTPLFLVSPERRLDLRLDRLLRFLDEAMR
jgi:hypothetical protein